MSFLNPLWLALGAAIAVPLVLHLMRRRIHNRVDFPAVRYLERAEKENVRKLKMRNLLLMMLRIATVLCLTLAAARPLASLFGAGHVPTALAIVLDNSLSTSAVVDGQPLLTRLRAAANTAASAASGGDRVWLVTADAQVVGGSTAAVTEAIERTDVFAGAGDLSAAVSRAVGLVSGAGMFARQVVVVTDGQATAWAQPVATGDVRISVLAPATGAPRNRAIIQADVRPSRWTPRGSVVARAQLPDSATYRIALGGTRLASGTARGSEDLTVHATPTLTGWQAGVVELEPDELRGDDVRHFATWLGSAPRVQLDAGATPFLRTAVEALVQNQRAAMGNDVFIGSADAAPKLPALLIAPSDPARIGAANRTLERLGVPWRFGTQRSDRATVRGDRLGGVHTSVRFPLVAQARATADTLATAGGEAWIVGGPRYVIIASPLDPAATDLPVRAGFVPWLGDVVSQRLAGDASQVINTAPGKPIRVIAGADGLQSSDGTPIAAGVPTTAPTRTGTYFITRGSTRIGAVVVNAEPEESDLRRAPVEALRDRFQGRSVAATPDEAAWRRTLFDTGARRPVQFPLILAALALLAAEVFVVRRSERVAAA